MWRKTPQDYLCLPMGQMNPPSTEVFIKTFYFAFVCVFFPVMGNCLFAYGRKLGELCRRDADCESGLICDVSALSGASVCRAPMAIAKQYAEDCVTSSDCDITRYVFYLQRKKKTRNFAHQINMFIHFDSMGYYFHQRIMLSTSTPTSSNSTQGNNTLILIVHSCPPFYH